jgi:RimJ/RimL family protein N-acetyltransferase
MQRIKIRKDNLLIANFKLSDINKNYIQWLNDKKLLKYSNNKFINYNKKKCVSYFKSFKNSQNLFLSIKNNKLELIGTITCFFSCNNKICDIGILLGDKNHRSKGLGLKSWKMIMSFLANNYNLKKISAGTIKENIKMLYIFKKSKMVYDGFRKKNFYDKKFFDLVFYAKYF